jgi:hypothetical protein
MDGSIFLRQSLKIWGRCEMGLCFTKENNIGHCGHGNATFNFIKVVGI